MSRVSALISLPEGASVVSEQFVRFQAVQSSRAEFVVGLNVSTRGITCCHRYEPFWMVPKAVGSFDQVPKETQYLLCQLQDDSYLLIIPTVDGGVRCSIEGAAGGLKVVAETGDTSVEIPEFLGLFLAVGPNPFALIEESAQHFVARFKHIRLRTQKPLPAFTNWFGWCTWDAFYSEVSEEKVRTGLESFRDIGVEPRYLILDDGWLSTRNVDELKSKQLTSFAANEKFPNGLGSTVEMAKEEFNVSTVLAWHAMTGYWGGVDPSFPGYDIQVKPRVSSPGIQSYVGELGWWGAAIGLVSPNDIYRFFHDFHRELRAQGIDGVKVDVQAQLETVAEGTGGRTHLMRAYHEALEGSVAVHFEGNLINCMSCANEMLYGAPSSNLTRTSTDFWPDKPESHGLHLYTNAQVSTWFGEFIHPDWDMFQSGHPAGAYHAAGRALSGGPVYVSDKPGAHNEEVLKRLVLPDGTILRTKKQGRPTADCLFVDPTKEDVLLKIFSTNTVGGVIGAFNARYGGPDDPITVSGSIRPTDVDGIFEEGEDQTAAVYGFKHQSAKKLGAGESWDIFAGELGWEIFTVVPIKFGFAPLGLRELMNSGGAIRSWTPQPDSHWVVPVAAGTFVAYSDVVPKSISVNGQGVAAQYYPDEKLILVEILASDLPFPVVKFDF